jgi:membrane fusion protein, macrolide-specific efflux system
MRRAVRATIELPVQLAEPPLELAADRTMVGFAFHQLRDDGHGAPPRAAALPVAQPRPGPRASRSVTRVVAAERPSPMVPTPAAVAPATRKPRHRVRWALLAGAALVAALTAVALRGEQTATAARRDANTAAVTRGTLIVKILETGKVEPKQQAQIRSRVGGVVTEVAVKEGQNVRLGDVLLRLDSSDYQREVERMAADMEEKQGLVALASSRKRNTAQGFRLGVVSRAELESVSNDLVLARARLKAAAVAQRTARDQVRYTTVLAPFAGRIIGRNVHPGEVVTAGMTATVEGRPLLVLAKISELSVRAELNQIDFARVRLGQKARITLDLLPDKEFAGQVVSRAASSATGSTGSEVLPIEIRMVQTEDLAAITPGMTADVEIEVARKRDVLLLPLEAVSSEGTTKTVQLWSEKNQRFEAHVVQTGEYDDHQIEITGGLSEGMSVHLGARPSPRAGG